METSQIKEIQHMLVNLWNFVTGRATTPTKEYSNGLNPNTLAGIRYRNNKKQIIVIK